MCQKLERAGKYIKLEPAWNDLVPAENLYYEFVNMTKTRACIYEISKTEPECKYLEPAMKCVMILSMCEKLKL